MSTSIEYQFHSLASGINNAGPGFPADGDMVRTAPVGYLRMVKSWGGLALLLSLGVIGIPFLVYFVALGATTVLRAFG